MLSVSPFFFIAVLQNMFPISPSQRKKTVIIKIQFPKPLNLLMCEPANWVNFKIYRAHFKQQIAWQCDSRGSFNTHSTLFLHLSLILDGTKERAQWKEKLLFSLCLSVLRTTIFLFSIFFFVSKKYRKTFIHLASGEIEFQTFNCICK